MGTVWYRDVFLTNCGDIRPQFLLMDNHHSHETLGLLEIASENEIHVLAFPPNSMHYLCPLEGAVFGPFQREYNTVCTEFMAASAGAIVNKLTFPKLVKQAYIKTFSRRETLFPALKLLVFISGIHWLYPQQHFPLLNNLTRLHRNQRSASIRFYR